MQTSRSYLKPQSKPKPFNSLTRLNPNNNWGLNQWNRNEPSVMAWVRSWRILIDLIESTVSPIQPMIATLLRFRSAETHSSSRVSVEKKKKKDISPRAFLEIGLYIISNYRFTTTSGQTGLINKDSLISYHQYFILVINLLFNFEKLYWTTVTEDQTLYYIKKIIAILSKFFLTLVLLFNWRQDKRSIIVKISTKI